jgi:flagellar hook assembly protein FlgD
MRISLLGLLVFAVSAFFVAEPASANVFPSNVRVTQEGSSDPFDGSFTDGTGAAIRFVLSDHADSAVVVIKDGSTVVRTIRGLDMSMGDTSVVWDGKDDGGLDVGNGDYSIQITTFDAGYSAYTELFWADPAIFTRGVTSVRNPAFANFGFMFAAGNGGYVTGIARHSADVTQWGDVLGDAKLTNTGATVGPSNLRYSSESDMDGYVYLIGRDNREVYRYHTDTLDVALVDSGGYETTIQGIAVRGVAADQKKYLAIAGTEKVYGFLLGDKATHFAPKDVLLDGDSTLIYWDVVFGRDSIMYATYYHVGDSVLAPGIAKFDLTGYTGTPLTFADTVWTTTVDTGRGNTCTYFMAENEADDVLYYSVARRSSGDLPAKQNVYAVTDLNAAMPTQVTAYVDKQNNMTQFRSDVTVDVVGNLIFFENSNEETVLISPPDGANSYMLNALALVKVFTTEPIADVRIQSIDPYVPDRMGDTVTVAGVVNGINFTASSNRFSYNIQDATGGINITKGSEFGGGTVYDVGDRILVTGVVGQFAGVTQLNIADITTDVTLLSTGNALTTTELTIPEYLADPETYESVRIKILGVEKAPGSEAWPDSADSEANMDIWDGVTQIILRADRDTDLWLNPEPTYPMNVEGVGTQYTFNTPPNDEYQVSPSYYADITQNVPVPPNAVFPLLTPADMAEVVLNDTAQTVMFSWNTAVDLNGDTPIYQWFAIGFTPVPTGNGAQDTFLVRTGKDLLPYFGAADTVELAWTVITKDPGPTLVYNSDTLTVTLIRGTITGVVDDMGLPTEFALAQNYPNPFNPTTTIQFALPMQATVTLKIYDVVGREIVTLVEGVQEAGYHEVNWNSSNARGLALASGVYFYRLEAQPADGSNAFVQLKKMMLLK